MTTEKPALASPRPEKNRYVERMRFGVLGPIEAFEKRRRLSVGGPKQRTVLALLVARSGTPVSTDALVAGIYGDESPRGARRSVQTYISNLRGEFGEVIEATGSGYVLKADRSEVDAFRFEDAVVQASNMNDPDAASEALGEALGLWRGHAYADVDGLFDLTAERTRLTELRVSAIELRVDMDLERGHHRRLIAELDSLTSEYPLRERFRAQQMLALYRCGRQAEALRAYEKTRTYLISEMGLDPSPDLRELERRILDQDPSLGFDTGPTVKHASILVADVADPDVFSRLAPTERDGVITRQAVALQKATDDNSGELFSHRGSAMYAIFDDVAQAVGAAIATQQTLAASDDAMRMAISDGEVQIARDEAAQGPPVTRGARLAAAAHGGQILLSPEANKALAETGGAGWIVRSLGQHAADGSSEARPVYQLMIDGFERDFPPLRTELSSLTLPLTSRGLPGYEIREEVGSGVFGVVHRAYQPSVGREVAIKIIKSDYANDSQYIRRFEVEAQLVARLEHPHIIPLHDYWRNPDGAYLVMRWLGGGTLKDRLVKDGDLTVGEVHQLLSEIGPALDFAHRRGVIHRDIKPSNVMFDDDGSAYLADFGIASDIGTHGVGSAARDVQALARVLRRCLGRSDQQTITDLLTLASDSEHFSDVRSFIVAWETAVGVGGTASPTVGYTPTRNPYKGISAFGEHDAIDFHGRDSETQEIVDKLAEHRLVAVVGPSGIGKSSVTRAGLIPALRQGSISGSERWFITDMLPGAYPYEELASALLRVASEMPSDLEKDLRSDARGLARAVKRYIPNDQTVLLIVDQFEELFTLVSDAERDAFLALLAATVDDERSNVRVVITMRADFFDRPLRFSSLGNALRAGTVPISAPSGDALRLMVSEPAAGVGVSFEPGLIDRVVSDVKQQPGALPLLEFSLTELFEQRDSDQLTINAYLASGGVLAALGRRAESTYSALEPEGKLVTREVMLRLISVTDSGRPTRRRVRVSELEHLEFADAILEDMLRAFGAHRLLTFDRDPITHGPTVEVAHEAILSEWPRLAGWVEEHQEDLLLRSRLAAAIADWEAADHSDTYLLTAGRLDQHETWTAVTELTLTSEESDFLTASRAAESHRRAQRRRTRRLVMSGFGIATIIALLLATAALFARNDAQDKAAIALGRELALQSVQQLTIDPERSILLAVEAIELSREAGEEPPEALAALHEALQSHRIEARYPGGQFVAVSPDGSLMATAHDGNNVAVWNLESGSVVQVLEREGAIAKGVSFSPAGEHLGVVYGGVQSPVRIWNYRNGEYVDLDGGDLAKTALPPWIISFAEDGNLVAANLQEGVRVWNLDTDEHVDIAISGDFDFSPIENLLAIGDGESRAIRIFEASTGLEVRQIAVDIPTVASIAFSPDGTRVAAVSAFDGVLSVLDMSSGHELARTTLDRPQGQVSWSKTGTHLLVGGDSGVPRVINARTGEAEVELPGHQGLVWATATTLSDQRVITAGVDDDATLVWNIEGGLRPEVHRLETDVPRLRNFGLIGDGETLFVAGRSTEEDPATVMVIDADDAEPRLGFDDQIVEPGRETHPIGDGSVAATRNLDGSSSVVSLTTGQTQYDAPIGSFVHAMTLEGDRVLLSSASAADGQRGFVTEIVNLSSGDAVPVNTVWIHGVFNSEFSPDGRLVWIWGGGDFVFFDTSTGQEAFRLAVHNVRFMPTVGSLAVIDNEGTLYVADLAELASNGAMPQAGDAPDDADLAIREALTEASPWQSKAHDSFTPVLVPSRDGSLMLTTGGNVEPAKVWNVADGSLVTAFRYGLTGSSARGAFHSGGGRVMLLSDGGTLLTFTLDTDELLDIARDRLTRDFTESECQRFLHLNSCTDR
ncbi:MAG: BTAD domain-containing putative transcriptional regulator [Actinomycetota bacterium]